METEQFKYVVASDPGGTTGVAALRYKDSDMPELVYLHQIPDGVVGFYDFFGMSETQENVAVVSEVWEDRALKGADQTPLVIQGAQYAIWQGEIEYQSPSLKKLISDQWLKDNNLWTPGRRHQMDALIHAFVYLRNQGHRPTLEALSDMPTDPIEKPGGAEEKQLEGSGNPGLDPESDELAELLTGLAKAMEGDDEGEGSGDGEYDDDAVGYGTTDKEAVGLVRKEINGVFVGYEPADENTSVLFSD